MTSSSSGVRPNQQPTTVTSEKVHPREREREKKKQLIQNIWKSRYEHLFAGKQLIYQIPNDAVLTTKIGLLRSLREYEGASNKISHGRGLRSRTVSLDTHVTIRDSTMQLNCDVWNPVTGAS